MRTRSSKAEQIGLPALPHRPEQRLSISMHPKHHFSQRIFKRFSAKICSKGCKIVQKEGNNLIMMSNSFLGLSILVCLRTFDSWAEKRPFFFRGCQLRLFRYVHLATLCSSCNRIRTYLDTSHFLRTLRTTARNDVIAGCCRDYA